MLRYKDRQFVWGKKGQHHLGVECGQRWWRWHSWFNYRTGKFLGFRPLERGGAFGPIMYWRD